MPVLIHSTLSGHDEELIPLAADGVVRMYMCGMTPKFHPHVGHARTFVAMDVIRRYLEYRGYRVKYVQNFTDIDDKIIQRAEREGRDAGSTAQAYIDSYFEVMDRLGVRRADEYPRVTDYIERIVEFIAGLVESDHAYAAEGDVYFDVASFPDYGKLSRRDLNSQLVAASKELEPGKRDPRDFALWKRAKPGEPSWPSPWGGGRPGWHIECSAMARETLGDQLDIHGGGRDLIFPHHENEIAQSESLTGVVPFARIWAHAGLVTIGSGEKMAHSLENFATIEDVLRRYEPNEVRYFFVKTHYRSSLAFMIDEGDEAGATIRGVEEARTALARLRRAIGDTLPPREGEVQQTAVDAFQRAMDSDFNTPAALAVIWDLVRDLNTLRDEGGAIAEVDIRRRTIVQLLDVLAIELPPPMERDGLAAAPYIELLLETRQQLRTARQFALADGIRDRLATLGIAVEDRADGGSAWRRAEAS